MGMVGQMPGLDEQLRIWAAASCLFLLAEEQDLHCTMTGLAGTGRARALLPPLPWKAGA